MIINFTNGLDLVESVETEMNKVAYANFIERYGELYRRIYWDAGTMTYQKIDGVVNFEELIND